MISRRRIVAAAGATATATIATHLVLVCSLIGTSSVLVNHQCLILCRHVAKSKSGLCLASWQTLHWGDR